MRHVGSKPRVSGSASPGLSFMPHCRLGSRLASASQSCCEFQAGGHRAWRIRSAGAISTGCCSSPVPPRRPTGRSSFTRREVCGRVLKESMKLSEIKRHVAMGSRSRVSVFEAHVFAIAPAQLISRGLSQAAVVRPLP
jgi:hypothetical protein